MKLLTLSEFITNEANKILNRDKGFMTKEESLRASVDVIFAYNHLLKKPLTLSMFVPCKDGKPLDEPKDYGFYCSLQPNQTFSSGFLPQGKKMDEWAALCKAYQEAEKAVIFEGFEIYKCISSEEYYIESKYYGLDWYGYNGNARLYPKNKESGFGIAISKNIATVSDLAEATKDNPITLKVKK